MIAVFLSLLLLPYWLLALAGIYTLIVGCVRIYSGPPRQYEELPRSKMDEHSNDELNT